MSETSAGDIAQGHSTSLRSSGPEFYSYYPPHPQVIPVKYNKSLLYKIGKKNPALLLQVISILKYNFS